MLFHFTCSCISGWLPYFIGALMLSWCILWRIRGLCAAQLMQNSFKELILFFFSSCNSSAEMQKTSDGSAWMLPLLSHSGISNSVQHFLYSLPCNITFAPKPLPNVEDVDSVYAFTVTAKFISCSIRLQDLFLVCHSCVICSNHASLHQWQFAYIRCAAVCSGSTCVTCIASTI